MKEWLKTQREDWKKTDPALFITGIVISLMALLGIAALILG